jgi:hypothetical protein
MTYFLFLRNKRIIFISRDIFLIFKKCKNYFYIISLSHDFTNTMPLLKLS